VFDSIGSGVVYLCRSLTALNGYYVCCDLFAYLHLYFHNIYSHSTTKRFHKNELVQFHMYFRMTHHNKRFTKLKYVCNAPKHEICAKCITRDE
jgi:hypothetical protein